jgi:hypothetical protein
MNNPVPFPDDPRLLEIYELGARITVTETKDARLWLWGQQRALIDAYLRDVTATAAIGKRSDLTKRG